MIVPLKRTPVNTLQTEVRSYALHGLTAEKAFRNRYGSRCWRSKSQL